MGSSVRNVSSAHGKAQFWGPKAIQFGLSCKGSAAFGPSSPRVVQPQAGVVRRLAPLVGRWSPTDLEPTLCSGRL